MNRNRRKRIDNILERIEEIESEIVDIRDEEQEAFDNLPESIQFSERGEAMEDSVSCLEEIDFSDIIESLNSAKGQ